MRDSAAFSPGMRTQLKGVVEPAGQGCGQPSATWIDPLGSGSASRHLLLCWRMGLTCSVASTTHNERRILVRKPQ